MRVRRIGLEEPVEHPRLIGLGNAAARVGHRQVQTRAAVRAVDVDRDAQHHLAHVGELHGVAGEVRRNLPKPVRIADDLSRHIGVNPAGDAQPLGRGLEGGGVCHALEQFPDVEDRLLEAQLAGFDLREIEQVVDEKQQRVRTGADSLEPVALLERQLGGAHELGHAKDGVQRRPDLVAHAGEELALRKVRHLRLVACPEEIGHGEVAVGNVADEADVGRPVSALDAREREFGRKLAAVPGAGSDVLRDARLGHPWLALRHHRRGCRGRELRAGEPGNEPFEIDPKRLRAVAGEDALGRAVELQHMPLVVERDDAVGRGVEHGAAAGVDVVERALGLDQLVDVVRRSHQLDPVVSSRRLEQILTPVVAVTNTQAIDDRRTTVAHRGVEGRAQFVAVVRMCVVEQGLRMGERQIAEVARRVLAEKGEVVRRHTHARVDDRGAGLQQALQPGAHLPQF